MWLASASLGLSPVLKVVCVPIREKDATIPASERSKRKRAPPFDMEEPAGLICYGFQFPRGMLRLPSREVVMRDGLTAKVWPFFPAPGEQPFSFWVFPHRPC